jgi:molecular chaperone Hsp33
MNDYLVRVIAREAGVRGLACVTTNLVDEACRRHKTPAAVSLALGEALIGCVLFGTLLKVGQRVAIKFETNQSSLKVVVEEANNGKVRGYAAVSEDDFTLQILDDDEPVLGPDGWLTVVKDLRLKNLYNSIVPLTGGGVTADLNHYLNQSEQLPSILEAGVILSEVQEQATSQVRAAGGLLVQALPPYEVDEISRLANRIQEMPPVEVMLSSGQTPETILASVFGEIEYEVLEVMPLSFSCSCSKERTRQALISLGREELIHLLETEGQAVVDCHFCHEHYLFDAEELSELIEKL